MAEENIRAGAEPGEAGAVEATDERTAQETADEVVTLTKKELQSRIDREVQKALRTRTANLEKEKTALLEQLESLKRQLEEAGMTVEEKVKTREKELEQARNAVKAAEKQMQAMHKELEELVQAEIAVLSEEDKMLVDSILTDEMSPLMKLRIIRALRNTGKISAGPSPERTVGNVGTVVRPATGVGGRAATPEGRLTRLVELGRQLSGRRKKEAGYVPPQWQNV